MTQITGNTYPVREQLKKLGGRWDPRLRVWMVPEDRADDARSAVSAVTHQRPALSGNTRPQTGLCRRCDSYCYGDCEAN